MNDNEVPISPLANVLASYKRETDALRIENAQLRASLTSVVNHLGGPMIGVNDYDPGTQQWVRRQVSLRGILRVADALLEERNETRRECSALSD